YPRFSTIHAQSGSATPIIGGTFMDTTVEAADLLSISQLQRLTGEAESTWRKRIGRRELPFIKLGANLRVKRADFELGCRIEQYQLRSANDRQAPSRLFRFHPHATYRRAASRRRPMDRTMPSA